MTVMLQVTFLVRLRENLPMPRPFRSPARRGRVLEPRSSPSGLPFYRRLRLEPLEDRRLLATVTVGSLSDVVDGDVSSIAALVSTPGADGISLREAMLAANADAAADTVGFAVTGVIQLTNVGHAGEIAITNSVTIEGPGASLVTIRAFAGTTSSGDGSRIFRIDDGTATLKDIFIEGLTLTGGDRTLATDGADGGAILNSENLTLTACTVSGNRATSGNGRGGGVFSQLGGLTLIASSISGNSSVRGGGVYASGVGTTIRDSTIVANSATAISGNGGGGIVLVNIAGSLSTITNSTISGNFCSSGSNGGGILNASAGSVIISYSTIALNGVNFGNGGGIHSTVATVSLDHTIVAGNLRSSPSAFSDLTGSATSARFSLIGVNTGSTITDNGGNQIGTGASPIDSKLAPLAENGGPTLTHAPLAGSPAIDAGDPTAAAGVGPIPLHDQRDSVFTRVADGDGVGGARIDIGAYERQVLPGLNLVVDTLADENDHDYSAGNLSLREAIDLANGSVGSDTISFAAALTAGGPATIQLVQGELVIGESLTISGPGANWLMISAYDPTPEMKNGDGSRIFNIDDRNASNASNVAISGVTLTGGDSSGSGGAILANENLVLSDSIITGNASRIPNATQGGGGIYSGYGGNLTVVRCVITNNSCIFAEGGGIRKRGGQLIVQDSWLESNVAGWVGGAISASDGGVNVVISRTSIKSNASNASSSFGGGGLFFYGPSAVVRDSLITGNTSLFAGGGIDASGGTTLSIIGTTVSGNTAASSGGGLRVSGPWEIAFSTITANTAPAGMGSGVWVPSGSAAVRVFRSSIIAGNTNSDVDGDLAVIQSSGFNLIGTGNAAGAFNQTGDQTGVTNPLLGPLADNGGPTMTHALLPGSPALDAGDPAAVAGVGGVPHDDQRGTPFGRIYDGDDVGGSRIDIGAFESRPIPPTVIGDYNADGTTDSADYVLWRKTLGTTVTDFIGADGDGDGVVDQDDYAVWRTHFGETVSAVGSGVESLKIIRVASSESVGNGSVKSTAAEAIESSAVARSILSYSAHSSGVENGRDGFRGVRTSHILNYVAGVGLALQNWLDMYADHSYKNDAHDEWSVYHSSPHTIAAGETLVFDDAFELLADDFESWRQCQPCSQGS